MYPIDIIGERVMVVVSFAESDESMNDANATQRIKNSFFCVKFIRCARRRVSRDDENERVRPVVPL